MWNRTRCGPKFWLKNTFLEFLRVISLIIAWYGRVLWFGILLRKGLCSLRGAYSGFARVGQRHIFDMIVGMATLPLLLNILIFLHCVRGSTKQDGQGCATLSFFPFKGSWWRRDGRTQGNDLLLIWRRSALSFITFFLVKVVAPSWMRMCWLGPLTPKVLTSFLLGIRCCFPRRL